MTKAALSDGIAPSGPARGIGGWAGFGLYLLGLFGTCVITWWGAVSLGWWWRGGTGIGFEGPWIIALPYLSAWAVLSFVSPWKAALAALAFPIILSATWLLGLIVGFITFLPLLAVPGFVCAAAVTGGFLMLAQRLDRRIRMRDWAPTHVVGFSLVGLAAAYVFFAESSFATRSLAPEKFWAALLPVMVALALHAVWSWIGLIREGRTRVSPLRVVVLLGAAYLGIGAAFVAGAPGRSLLAWPAAPGHDPIQRARNLDWFASGETITLRGPRGAETFKVPAGWRARPFWWPVTALRLEPLPGTAAETGPIEIFLALGNDWLPEAGGEGPPTRPHPRSVRCTAQPPAPAGLVLCRSEALIRTLPEEPNFLAWDGLELAFVLGAGVESFLRGRYVVFGPALRGACLRGERCRLRLPLAGGGSASFEVAEEALGNVERVRAEAEALLRSAGAAAVAPTREAWPGLR